MKIGKLNLPNIKPQKAWLLPLFSLAAWWAMLVAMMICWFAKGRPILDTDHSAMPHFIVYLSNVAATDLQPIFIVGAALMGIFYVWAVIEEYHLRRAHKNYLPKSFAWYTHGLQWLAIAMAVIASLCILMVSCLKDNWRYSYVHSVFVILFVIFVFVYLCFHSLVFLIYYKHYKIKYFLTSAIIKIVWTLTAIGLVVCYGAFMGKANSEGEHSNYWGYSAIMEWALVFFYGTMMFIISSDLRIQNYGNYYDYYINNENERTSDHDQYKEEYDDSEISREVI